MAGETALDLAGWQAALLELSSAALSSDAQQEVAKISKVVARLDRKGLTGPNPELTMAVRAIQSDPPNLLLARELRYAVKMETGTFRNGHTAWFMKVTGGSPTAIMVVGLSASMIVWLVLDCVLLWAFNHF